MPPAPGPWHAVDAAGRDPATGRPPAGPGAPSPPAALALVPVATWPLEAVDGRGGRVAFGAALGPGGNRVEELLHRVAGAAPPPAGPAVAELALSTPAGRVGLPVAVVDLAAAVRAAGAVDREWGAAVDACHRAPRAPLVADGREVELEAALHLAMLLGTEAAAAGDEAARVASGARLWLLGGAVAWALVDDPGDPFAAWGDLVSYGLWPVGPAGGRLVVSVP